MVFSNGVRYRGDLYSIAAYHRLHMLDNSNQNGLSTSPLLLNYWNASYKGVSITFWQKILALTITGGRRRGSEKTVKSDWLTSKAPILLFIWTLPSHSAWLPARQTVLLFLYFFSTSLHTLFFLYSLWFLSNSLCYCVLCSALPFPLTHLPQHMVLR